MDPYQMLGITKGCGPEELKEAFRTKALLVHPDRGGDGRDFIRLRQAYDQIVAELKRTPSALTVGPARNPRIDRRRREPEPDWEPDLIVLDEPLPRVRPVRPPQPNWEPDLIVRDEPLPRIHPARPRDSNWEPDMILADDDTGPGPGPGTSQSRGLGDAREQDIGWLPGGGTRPRAEAPRASEGWYARIGVTAFVFIVILGIWMAWPAGTETPPHRTSELAPSHLPESFPGVGNIPVSDWPDTSSGMRQITLPDRPDSSLAPGQLLPPR